MVQHIAHREDLVDQVLLLLLQFISGKALALDIESVGLTVCLTLSLGVEACLHLLTPEQARGVDEVAHQVRANLVDGDRELRLAVLIGSPGNGEEVIEQPEVMVDDILSPYVVLKFEVLFLDDVKFLAAGLHADVGEEEQLRAGIEGGKVQRNLVDTLEHTCRQLRAIEHQVENRQVTHLIDDPLAHELADILGGDAPDDIAVNLHIPGIFLVVVMQGIETV